MAELSCGTKVLSWHLGEASLRYDGTIDAMEIPLELLFMRSGLTAETTLEIVSRILTYLLEIHGSTFTNTAIAAAPLQHALLNEEGPSNLDTLKFSCSCGLKAVLKPFYEPLMPTSHMTPRDVT
jgi:hypothetical protein